jgi:hypothetical protein
MELNKSVEHGTFRIGYPHRRSQPGGGRESISQRRSQHSIVGSNISSVRSIRNGIHPVYVLCNEHQKEDPKDYPEPCDKDDGNYNSVNY